MKHSIIAASLILTGTLFAGSANHKSPLQEGVHAIKTLENALSKNIEQKLQEENNSTSVMQVCLTEADRTMEEVKGQLPAHVTLRISSPDINDTTNTADTTDMKMMEKYQSNIEKQTAGALMMSSSKVGKTVRIYKPVIINSIWLKCYDGKVDVKEGDFKGVFISEVASQH